MTQSARDLASLAAWLRTMDRWDETWPKEVCRSVLQAALQSGDPAGGAMYRRGQGERELLCSVGERPRGSPPDTGRASGPPAKEPYVLATDPQEDGSWRVTLTWPGPRDGDIALALWFHSRPDVGYLDALGMVVGLAMENGRLRRGTERELRQGELLYRVSQAFTSTLDLQTLLDLAVALVAERMESAENCVVHLLHPESDLLVARSVSSKEKAAAPSGGDTPLRPGLGAAGLALLTGRVINIGNVHEDARFLPRVGSRIGSLLTAPLVMRGESIGTLTVSSSRPYAFGEEDERLLMTLAILAGTAIHNVNLVASLQKSLDELRDTQAQLLQSEKLSALGQLIAGITHEINNPLAAISGYAQLLKMNDDLDPQTRQDVTRIYEQAQRAARIVRNLLTFAREHQSMQRPTDVNALLRTTIELLAYQLRVEGISVSLHLAPETMSVMADPYQLQQVFFNLISNARDAMVTNSDGGRLTVTTARVGSTVRICIGDTGPGLTPEAKQHLFEPFFTTKEVGRGTGLGLSICFGIVSDHAGRIYLAESDATGAEFAVELPHTDQPPHDDDEITADHLEYLANRLILLVEDEEPIARVIHRVLLRDGHRAVVTRDGNEALAYLRRAQERGVPFDLIISDVKMPNMDGAELYRHILLEYPQMTNRILYMTGDSISPSTRSFLGEYGLPFLIKPFDLGELRQAISDNLG